MNTKTLDLNPVPNPKQNLPENIQNLSENILHPQSQPPPNPQNITQNPQEINQNLPPIDAKIPDNLLNSPNPTEPSYSQKELQQLKEQLLIAQADFDNFRKRSTRDQEDIRRFACASIIEELLPILDNFEIGLKSIVNNDNTYSGFQMILSQLKTLLINKGLKEIIVANTPFNPLQQEAVAYVHHPEILPEYVVETVRKGYFLHDRLLRSVSVIVSKGKLSENNNNSSEEF
jgi:molecular chaperone GrpE